MSPACLHNAPLSLHWKLPFTTVASLRSRVKTTVKTLCPWAYYLKLLFDHEVTFWTWRNLFKNKRKTEIKCLCFFVTIWEWEWKCDVLNGRTHMSRCHESEQFFKVDHNFTKNNKSKYFKKRKKITAFYVSRQLKWVIIKIRNGILLHFEAQKWAKTYCWYK